MSRDEPRCFLAVDLGAGSGRVVAASFDGERLTLAEIHRFDNGPISVGDHIHWDLGRIFGEVLVGLELAVKLYGENLGSIAVDTWGVDYVLLDENDEPLGDPYHYRDGRTDGMEDALCREVPRCEIYGVTGIQFMFFNTLLQLYSEVRGNPSSLGEAHRLLLMPDMFHFLLSGRFINERTIASTTQLLDARSGEWSTALLERLGIPTRLFGEIVPPGHIVGELLPELQEKIGAPPLTVVAPGSHDTASAVAAVPATGSDHGYISSGTWSLMGVETEEPIITDDSRAAGFTNEQGVGGSVRFLKNISGMWIIQECRRIWEEAGESFDYAELTELAAGASAFSGFIDPDDSRFGPPGDMPRRIREFLEATGQDAPATPGALVRIALESLAMRYRTVHQELRRITGSEVSPLHVVGGGAHNDLLNQFTANALGISVIAGPAEATAIGNSLVQMMALGVVSGLDDGRQLVRRSFETHTFEPRDGNSWNEAYERYQKIEARH